MEVFKQPKILTRKYFNTFSITELWPMTRIFPDNASSSSETFLLSEFFLVLRRTMLKTSIWRGNNCGWIFFSSTKQNYPLWCLQGIKICSIQNYFILKGASNQGNFTCTKLWPLYDVVVAHVAKVCQQNQKNSNPFQVLPRFSGNWGWGFHCLFSTLWNSLIKL